MKHLLIFLFLSLGASGAELANALMPPASPVASGSFVQLDFASLNPGHVEVPFVAPASLAGRLEAASGSSPVLLEGATSAPLTVAPGGFAVRHYRLKLPEGLRGRTVLVVETPNSGPLHAVLEIRAEQRDSSGQPPTPLAKVAAFAPASAMLARSFAGRFLPNQPVYFVYGNSEQAAKFQFSFDYRLATFGLGDSARSAITTLRVGYTQRSVWDIDADSSPFYDSSYMPEIAFCSDRATPAEVSRWFTWLGWRVGYQHESNGQQEKESRSLDLVYFRPRFVLGTLGGWAFVVLPEIHAHVGESRENSDIQDYRGYGKLRFYFGHNDGPSVMFTGWTGKDFDHGTWQLDLAVPTRLRWLNLESYLHVQYFNGYGESLRDYRLRSDAVRAGVSLVR